MIRLATRGSELAIKQATWVKTRLEQLGEQVSLVLIETQGDREQQPFAAMAGSGFFTKAVQEALLEGRADLAVHSYKDLPSQQTPGLEVAAVPERADPREVLLIRPEYLAEEHSPLPLKRGAVVGTSAIRRQAQLRVLRPDLVLKELRGNVLTRIQKLRDGHYHAIVLAAAGLQRLALEPPELALVVLAPEVLIPAPAQGALALEIRREDEALAALLTELHDARGYPAIAAERGLMAAMQAGCQLALGAHAQRVEGELELLAWFEGRRVAVRHSTAEGAAYLAHDALVER
ncbi:MAG: hydroxymethylbilane synthase [Truepera sp.]|nr:hydroxymethylbilane synthase [Truepera sp.]